MFLLMIRKMHATSNMIDASMLARRALTMETDAFDHVIISLLYV